jgi:hypothetical protein
MKLNNRIAVFVGAVALIAAIAIPSGALAGGKQYPTFYTKFKYVLKNGDSKFKGQIDSTKGGCIKDRKVVLYLKKNGNKKKLGGDHTNNKGHFDIDLGKAKAKKGTYVSQVNQAKIGNSGNKNICLEQKSPTLKLS